MNVERKGTYPEGKGIYDMKKKRSLLYIPAVSILSVAACIGAVSVNAYPDNEEVSDGSHYYYEESPEISDIFEQGSEDEFSEEISYEESSTDQDYSEGSTDYEESSGYAESYPWEESSYYEESSFEELSGASDASEEESSFQPSVFYVDGEPGEESSEESTETIEEISGYEYSDDNTLTSNDWETLKKDNTSRLEVSISSDSGKDNAIKKIKQDESTSNDDWIFLMWGLILIGAGVITIIITVVVSVLHKSKSSTANANYYRNYYKKRQASGTQPKPHNSPFINEDTSDIDINSNSNGNKDDYNDLY